MAASFQCQKRQSPPLKGQLLYLCQYSSHGCGTNDIPVFLPGKTRPTRGHFLTSLEECSRHTAADERRSSYQIHGSISNDEEASNEEGNASDASSYTQHSSIHPSPDELGDLCQMQHLRVHEDALEPVNVLEAIAKEHKLKVFDFKANALVFK